MHPLTFIALTTAFTPASVEAAEPDTVVTPVLDYCVEVSGTAGAHLSGNSHGLAPLWLTMGRHGLGSTESASGYIRAAIGRPTAPVRGHSSSPWKWGWRADLAAAAGHTSTFIMQQLYAEGSWHLLRLTLGSKERGFHLPPVTGEIAQGSERLTSGGMTISHNARPVPQGRIELADWLNIAGKSHFIAIRGQLAYGMATDGRWQESWTEGQTTGQRYARRVGYHEKALYFRISDPRRYRLTGMIGLEMVAQYGGEVWNIHDRGGTANPDFQTHHRFGNGIGTMWKAFIPGGSDVNDGDFANAVGNHLGSWVAALDYTGNDWSVRAYLDHFFEDHSMMFFEYGWRDNLIGLEAHFPKNRWIDHAVVEWIRTDDQSGPVYHDATSQLPLQISGKDTYYNHHIYGAYQHWGLVMGNPLLLSPIYNVDHRLTLYHNRLRAVHLGLEGQPSPQVAWRLLATHQRNFGTYDVYLDDARSTSVLAEATWSPQHLRGWSMTLAGAFDAGTLMGNALGATLTLRKTGIFEK